MITQDELETFPENLTQDPNQIKQQKKIHCSKKAPASDSFSRNFHKPELLMFFKLF